MKQDDPAANEADFDPLFHAMQRYTAPVALVAIVVVLVVIGWVTRLEGGT